MTSYFTRAGSPSEERVRDQLAGHELRFVGSLEEAGEEEEMLGILFGTSF